jgi:hypothetical protein
MHWTISEQQETNHNRKKWTETQVGETINRSTLEGFVKSVHKPEWGIGDFSSNKTRSIAITSSAF